MNEYLVLKIKNTNNKLLELTNYYRDDLKYALGSISFGGKANSYAEWSLQDCVDMLKFYNLLLDPKNYKKAYKKLRNLSKERALVPYKLEKILLDMFPNLTY